MIFHLSGRAALERSHFLLAVCVCRTRKRRFVVLWADICFFSLWGMALSFSLPAFVEGLEEEENGSDSGLRGAA